MPNVLYFIQYFSGCTGDYISECGKENNVSCTCNAEGKVQYPYDVILFCYIYNRGSNVQCRTDKIEVATREKTVHIFLNCL